MPKNVAAIGIDLGTTNSCVGVVRNGRVEIIANDMGNRITPSFVAFTEAERLIGDAAKEQASWNPENTVFDVKRLIGRKFDDPDVQKMIKRWPFRIKNSNGNVKIEVTYQDKKKDFTPEEISSMVLMKMKEVAETYMGCEVTDAVITVPAYFNDSQRQATIDAGKIAGLNVLRIINEPTAAAIAYGVERKSKAKRNILIYDLGGGTFDVVVMKVENNVCDVLAVNGDTFLGGGDFDNLLMDHFIKDLTRKFGININTNNRALGKLRKVCEKVKRNLSSSVKERIQIESIVNGVDLNSTISRVRFEEICSDVFRKTLEPVTCVLADAKLTKNEINEIVLVGGSTRIPKIRNLLQDYFDGKTLNNTINPDEAVAYGAALHAAVLSGESTVEEVLLHDVTPLSLGVAIRLAGDFEKIIARNSKIPTKNTVAYTTLYDFQKAVTFGIYEGERAVAELNHFLGEFTLRDIQIAPKHIPKFDCTFNIDRNGILHASAVDKSTGSHNAVTITSNKGRLNKEEIKQMMVEAKEFKEDEAGHKETLDIRCDLESFCFSTKAKINSKRFPRKSSFDVVERACDEVLSWLDANQNAEKEEYQKKKKMLQKLAANV